MQPPQDDVNENLWSEWDWGARMSASAGVLAPLPDGPQHAQPDREQEL